MTLTLLRRLVLAGSGLSFLGAGAAAWFSLQSLPAARSQESWMEYFPVKKTGGGDGPEQRPAPVTEYLEVIKWPQGDKPVVKVENTNLPPPKVDTLQYKLTGVFVGESPLDSLAQIQGSSPPGPAFSLRVGEQVPADPGAPLGPVLDWRLEGVKLGGAKIPASALFRNLETGEERSLTAEISSGGADLLTAAGSGRGGGTDIGKPSPEGRSDPNLKPRYIPLPAETDAAKGNFAFEIPEEEAAFLQDYSAEEAKKVDVIASEDGLIIKGLAPDSRAKSMGLKVEDRVIAVNGEKVTGTDQALGVGRRQYDSGTSTFIIKVLRAGKEMNFTYKAPKKKGGK